MKRIVLLGALTAVLGCAAEAEPPAVTGSARVQQASLELVQGESLLYELLWEAEAGVRPELDADAASVLPMAGGVQLNAQLELQAIGKRDGGTIVAAWYRTVDSVAIVVNDETTAVDPAQLLGQRAYLRLDADGDATRMWFDPESTSVFRHVMAGALDRVDFRAGTAGSAARVARTPHGLSQVRYAANGQGTVRRELDRLVRFDAIPGVDASAPTIAGTTEIELDERLVPVGITIAEQAEVRERGWSFGSRERFVLRRLETGPGETLEVPETLDAYPERDPHASPDLAESEQVFAQRMAQGLEVGDVRDATTAMDGGMFPHSGFISRAIGLLRGWPETAFDMEMVAHRAGPLGRQLVFDLLATAGTVEAQQVMRTIVTSEEARAWSELPMLVGRFAFVAHPTTETTRFLLELRASSLAEGRAELADAVLYPLGSLVQTLDRSDPWMAQKLHGELVSALDHASDSRTQEAAIDGLGNAARLADSVRVMPFVTHEDPDLRLAAVSALRTMVSPQTTAALVESVSDPDEAVATRALASLELHLGPDDLHVLTDLVARGEYNPRIEGSLVNALVGRIPDDPPATRAALQTLSQRTSDRDLKLRITNELAA